MSPAFPAKIGSGESSSATVRFECTATLHFYAEVLDLGPRDFDDSQDIDLRDFLVTGLMLKLNEREILHTADSRIKRGQELMKPISIIKGDELNVVLKSYLTNPLPGFKIQLTFKNEGN